MKDPDNTEFSENKINQPSLGQKIKHFYAKLGSWAWHLMLISGPFVFLYMCIRPPWQIFAVAYLFWMYYDRETPHKGGRRLKWLRKSLFWRGRKNYFPIELVKTAELPPDTTYLFGSFPHGFLALGWTNFMSDVNHFNEKFPGLNVYLGSLNALYKIPFSREILLFFGVGGCSSNSILHVLNGPPGNVFLLMIGGWAEMTKSRPGDNRIALKNRKGFVRLALKAGSSLVPVYTFGETDVYDQPFNGSWYRRIQESRPSGYGGLVFFKGPCKPSHLFGLLPYQKPITSVVGKPIKLPKVENPSDELVDKYHKIFVQEVVQLFDKHKSKYDSQGENAILNID